MFGQGISKEGDILDLGVETNIVEKSGAWFAFDGERIGQGRENAKDFLKEHPEVAQNIERKVLAHFSIARAGDPPLPAGKDVVGKELTAQLASGKAEAPNGNGHGKKPQPRAD